MYLEVGGDAFFIGSIAHIELVYLVLHGEPAPRAASGVTSWWGAASRVSSHPVAQPEHIGCEDGQGPTAENEPPGRQISDEGNDSPQRQRETQPAKEKRAKEPPGLHAVVRIVRRRHAECCHVSHLRTLYPAPLL
jgi:hypothetical protein